jgi:hypothetical protein
MTARKKRASQETGQLIENSRIHLVAAARREIGNRAEK